jgi:hypothetical protein
MLQGIPCKHELSSIRNLNCLAVPLCICCFFPFGSLCTLCWILPANCFPFLVMLLLAGYDIWKSLANDSLINRTGTGASQSTSGVTYLVIYLLLLPFGRISPCAVRGCVCWEKGWRISLPALQGQIFNLKHYFSSFYLSSTNSFLN